MPIFCSEKEDVSVFLEQPCKHKSTSISSTKTLKWPKAFNISQSRKALEQIQYPKTMVFK